MIKKVVAYITNLWYILIENRESGNMAVLLKKRVRIFDVANFFLKVVDRESGSTITPLKLQKLLYYAQGYYLAINGKELFGEDFQAWAHGPANVGIYEKYKSFGSNCLPEPTEEIASCLSPSIIEFLYDIWNTFGIYDGKYLEILTHKETPWIKAREGYKPGERCNVVITKESMKEFFKEKLNV